MKTTNFFNTTTKALKLGLILSLSSSLGFAATTGNLNLRGTVNEITEIVVSPQAVATSLDLSGAAADLVVGNVNERSNKKVGYTVTLSSANNGKLIGASGNTDEVVYTLKYNNQSVVLSGTVTITNSSTKTGGSGVDKSVKISYANPGFINADTYSDTLTFTIAAN